MERGYSPKIEQRFIEDEIIILSKPTLDKLFKEENPAELVALYTFYYYTAKWQKTDHTKATTEYTANGLCWTREKVRKHKKQLVSLGLIEDIQQKDSENKILGHYVKVNYVFWKEPPPEKPRGWVSQALADGGTNALNTNIPNALRTNTKYIVSNEVLSATRMLARKILRNNPKHTQLTADKYDSTINKWSRDIEKLHRIDKQSMEDIEKVIRWCQGGSSWYKPTNVSSAGSLREKWDKLYGFMIAEEKKQQQSTYKSTPGNFLPPSDPSIYDGIENRNDNGRIRR